ncbi:phosphoglycolate phosphatase [Undibacterium arcticum]|uniref:Phosphoglycolate phosphatase n=1 Tax=Undibacterium arcticum TaxID=1762892 RepID=A0ABV7F1Q6_9BURK
MGSIDTSQRAVLIDLDGTLVDTAPDIVEAASRMLQELGAPPLPVKTVSGFIGNGVPNLVRRVLEASAIKSAVQEHQALTLFYRHYRDTNGRFGQIFSGVRDGLTALQQAGYRLACVTNKPHAFTEPLLALTGLAAYFEVVVAGDSIAQMKPDPEPLLHACRQMQVDPALCVLVGDSEVDVAAARAARMPVYIVRYGYPGPDGYSGMQCDALIESFDELPALLAAPSL